MAYLKTVQTDTNLVIDENAELISVDTKRKQIVVSSTQEYFTVYASILGVLHHLSGGAIKLASYLIGNAPINNNYIVITEPLRNKIADDIGVKNTYVKALLKELCDKGILLKDKSSARNGGYYINPEYYWKGDMTGRTKAMKFLLELNYTL